MTTQAQDQINTPDAANLVDALPVEGAATVTKKKTPKKTVKKVAKAAKGKKAAKTKAAAVRPMPKSGQSGPALILQRSDLNPKETKLAEILSASSQEFSLAELAEKAWATQPKAKANSWVRNSLRRLVRGGWVGKAAKGKYQITEQGQNNLRV